MSKKEQGIREGQNFKVLHHQVGPWPRDHVLSYKDLMDHSPDVDVERLLATEAIEYSEDDVSGPPPVGPENRGVMVDPAGRVLDTHGYDRPAVIAEIPSKGREQMRQESAKRAGLNPDTLHPEGDPESEEEELEGHRSTDIRQRDGVNLAPEAAASYESMKVTELREEASGRNIEGSSSMNKADLIKALQEDDATRGQ